MANPAAAPPALAPPPPKLSTYHQRLLDKFAQGNDTELLQQPDVDEDDIGLDQGAVPEEMPLPALAFDDAITIGNLRTEVRRIITNPTTGAYYSFITREQACVHAVQQWCEIAELWPDENILQHHDLVPAVAPIPFLKSFHQWFATRLIFNAAVGPTYNIKDNICRLKDVRKINPRAFNGVVKPLVCLFVQKLNPKKILSVKSLMNNSMMNQQKNIWIKIKEVGIWSDEFIHDCIRRNVPLEPHHIRGCWFPFALAADRLLCRSKGETVYPTATNANQGQHYLTTSQKDNALWQENVGRRNFVSPFVPDLPNDNNTLPEPL